MGKPPRDRQHAALFLIRLSGKTRYANVVTGKWRPRFGVEKNISTFTLQLRCQLHGVVGMANFWHVSGTATEGFPVNGRYSPSRGGRYRSHHSATCFCVDLHAMVF